MCSSSVALLVLDGLPGFYAGDVFITLECSLPLKHRCKLKVRTHLEATADSAPFKIEQVLEKEEKVLAEYLCKAKAPCVGLCVHHSVHRLLCS